MVPELEPRAVTAAHISRVILPAFLVFCLLALGVRVGAWWSLDFYVERTLANNQTGCGVNRSKEPNLGGIVDINNRKQGPQITTETTCQ